MAGPPADNGCASSGIRSGGKEMNRKTGPGTVRYTFDISAASDLRIGRTACITTLQAGLIFRGRSPPKYLLCSQNNRKK